MNWKYLFKDYVLKDGLEIYEDGQVENLDYDGNQWTAWVEDYEDFFVSVRWIKNQMPVMRCSCEKIYGKYHCEHIAAVMYAIEDRQKANISESGNGHNQNDPQVFPFSKIGKEDERYRYFDMEHITAGLEFYQDSYQQAQKALREGQIRLDTLDTSYETGLDYRRLVATASGSAKMREYDWSVKASFNKDRILKLDCQVPGCYCHYDPGNSMHGYGRNNWGNDKQLVCTHGLALLLLAQERLQDENPGDDTDRAGQKMLATFRSRRLWEDRDLHQEGSETEKSETNAPERFYLEPRLAREYEGIKLSLKVGVGKMYVPKSLNKLVEAVDHKGILVLSPKTSIDMARHQISEESKPLYDFIRNVVKGEQSRRSYAEQSGYQEMDTSESIKGSILLYGKRLDDFFDLMEGKSLEFTDKYGMMAKGSIRFRESEPAIHLLITPKKENHIFQGIHLEGSLPQLLEGQEFQYYLSSHHFNRISRELLRNIDPLLSAMDYENHINMDIGRRNLSEFYYRILPQLQKYAEVEEKNPDVIRNYLPPEVKIAFYLDAEQNNLFCRGTAVYGETEYNLLDAEQGANKQGPNEEFRDRMREQDAFELAQRFFPYVDPIRLEMHCDGNEDLIYACLENGLSRLMEVGEVHTTDAFRRLHIHKKTQVSVGISISNDLMNLEILSEDLDQEELLDILYSYKRKKKFYRLRSGDFLNLQQDNLRELSSMLESLRVSPKEFTDGKMHLPLYRALYLDKMLESNEDIYADRDNHYRSLIKEFKTVGDSDYVLPASLRHVLRNYQKYGYKWLRTLDQVRFGGILADDMGLGKTIQVLAVLLAAKEEGKADGPSLIVCPASLVYNWLEEMQRFTPALKGMTITGSQSERKKRIADWKDYDVMITSYDLLKRDIAEYEDIRFHYQVIDEAQYIKNHTTAAAKAVKVIHSKIRYALTGTPIENRLSELWSIFDYLMPGLLYDYETFRRQLEAPIVKNQDEDAMQQLKRIVSPFILRRLKKDVLKDLPEKLEETRYARMESKQENLYSGQVVHMQKLLQSESKEEFAHNKIQILAELTKIRQICCDPSLYARDYKGESAKRELCMELVKSGIDGEHKMLIFSQFTSMLELLETDLKREGIPYYKITGAMPKEARINMVHDFNSDQTPVFLISLKAGGTGLNLTGADIVIHYDPWWNIAAQNQATDRAHRIGQTKTVTVYKLILKDTIEEKIQKMQETKAELAEEVLTGEMGTLSSLSKEELLGLLN